MNSFSEKDKSNNESTVLDPSEKRYYKPQSLWSRFKLQMESSKHQPLYNGYRIIKPGQPPYPRILFGSSNKVDNTKYKWYNFIALFLYFEFSQFSNLNYLLLCVSQFFPTLKVGILIRISNIIHNAIGYHTSVKGFRRRSPTLQNKETGSRD